MPRLTNPDYIKLHHALARHWHHDNFVYGTLSPNEQWDIHVYFQPSKTLTNEELLQHRKTITAEQPSLPHKAGRAIRNFEKGIILVQQRRQHEQQELQNSAAAPTATGKKTTYRSAPKPRFELPLKIYPLVNPEIDVQQLARAFVVLARHQLKERARSKSKTKNDV